MADLLPNAELVFNLVPISLSASWTRTNYSMLCEVMKLSRLATKNITMEKWVLVEFYGIDSLFLVLHNLQRAKLLWFHGQQRGFHHNYRRRFDTEVHDVRCRFVFVRFHVSNLQTLVPHPNVRSMHYANSIFDFAWATMSNSKGYQRETSSLQYVWIIGSLLILFC